MNATSNTRRPQWPLFKYHGINNCSLSNLAQRKLWSAPASSFNDPFEFCVQRGSTTRGLGQFRSEHPEFAALSDEQVVEQVVSAFQQEIAKFGVVCLSARADSILMWSHYADQHRGMCLGFTGDAPPNPACVLAVRYSDVYPEPTFERIWDLDGLAAIMTTKHEGWSYEDEYRMINVAAGQLIDYPGQLSQIIFGLRTSQADQTLVRRVVGEDSGVTYYQMEKSANGYTLTLQPR